MNDDATTLNIIRNFIASDKPASITPLDVLQMVHFISRKAEDHSIYDSQQTLARMFGTDTRTIARSQARLARRDWIARPQRRGKTCEISIKFQNVPAEEILRLKITPDAKVLACRYQMGLIKLGRKKFPKQWLHQQCPSAQRMIDACKGDVELAARIIGHALSNPHHAKRARQSLYHIFGRWKKILETWKSQHAQQTAVATEIYDDSKANRDSGTIRGALALTDAGTPGA